MLGTQQAAAKKTELTAGSTVGPASPQRDAVPSRVATNWRFRPGVDELGVAGDVLRIYVLEDLADHLETPAKVEGLHTERILTTGLSRSGCAPTCASLPQCGVSLGYGVVTSGTVDCRPGRTLHPPQNNHVLALANAASMGDEILQPGVPTRRVPTPWRGSRP
ncbi:MAG: hypothetical protein OXP36_08405 [Gammaproteobacteria bacterium]|nr:hypothetical protein [Gammaproteobacteria bacterium]